MESLNRAVTDRVTFSTPVTNILNSVVFISVIIIQAIIMVIYCVVCSIIIGIIIRSRNKTQYGLADKMITVNAENKTITENSKEMKTFKNEAYGCLRYGTNRIANADLQNIQMQDQESAEDQAYEYIS